MASIPNNGYAAVMAGTNVYTGSNFYGSDCPKTPIVPTDADDICNKLYVDTIAGGGAVVSVNSGSNISVTGTGPDPIVNIASPLTSTLALGAQDLTGVNGNQSITVNALGVNKQFSNAGVATATAQLLVSSGGDAILGVSTNNIATSSNHLLEVSANNTGPAKIEHITTTGATRNLEISSTGQVNISSLQSINIDSGSDTNITPNASCSIIAPSFFQASSSVGPNIASISTSGTGRVDIQATQGLFFTGASLQSGTSSGNSGQHLVIILNGSEYKIALQSP